jgi:hypothetical protein
MKAVFPGQLTIRYDIGRNMLIYDMFEFQPTTVDEFKQMYLNNENVCSESEIGEVERLLRSTERKRATADSFMMHMYGMPPPQRQECLSSNSTVQERIDAIGREKFCHLLNYIRFRKSRLMRIRFPLHGLRGIRLVELDYIRHNDELPAAKGLHPQSRLGGPGEEGFAPGHNTFEKCGDKLETLGLLVLEFGDQCKNLLSVPGNGVNHTISNEHPFASTVAYPKNWQERFRLPYKMDWTPDAMFSKSRRHYVVGDLSEMLELTNFLMSASSNVDNMLRIPLGDRFASARKILNSLSGDISVLRLNSTPSDTFPQYLKIDESSSSSLRSLKSLCLDVLVGSSTLRVEKQQSRQFETEDDVHDFLLRCGVSTYSLDDVNKCLKAALLNGKMSVPENLLRADDASSWLDQVLLSKECPNRSCKLTMTCTIRQVLYQDHRASQTRDDGYDRAPIQCGGFLCSNKYVTAICRGMPRFDRDNHNHCTECPGFGCCIGYWRNTHCTKCGGHYIAGRERCEGCKTKKVIDEYMQSKPSADDDAPPSESSWKGLIRGCNKFDLLSEDNKRRFIKTIRKNLVLIQSMKAPGLNKEVGGGNVDNVLREKLSSFPMETIDDIVENGCHAELDNKSVTELSLIMQCLVEIVSPELLY